MAVILPEGPARALRGPAAPAWALAGLTVLSLMSAFWLAELVWSTGWEPRASNAIAGAVILVTVSAATVGAVLASRRPRHPVGWLLLGVGLGLVGSLLVQSYVRYGLLGGAYAGVVLGLGQLLGRTSSLAVAVATLAVAALFQPARRRIQWAIDRRFNRRRYDAARTIQGFSGRLRQQVDLDTLSAELLGVVEQTMQPTSVSLWLRDTMSASARIACPRARTVSHQAVEPRLA
jgi:hypothetical protein